MPDNPVILDNQVNITLRDPNAPQQNRKVIQGTVKKIPQKEKRSQKLMHAFLGPDVDNAGEYILNEYLVPTGKRMLNNAWQGLLKKAGDGVQVLLFGRVIQNSNGNVDYTSFSNGGQTQPRAYKLMDAVETYAFANRSDAERCLMDLRGRITAYGSVSVLDYYESIGVPIDPMHYVLRDRGWNNLDNARVIPSPEGFIIDLPRPISLKV